MTTFLTSLPCYLVEGGPCPVCNPFFLARTSSSRGLNCLGGNRIACYSPNQSKRYASTSSTRRHTDLVADGRRGGDCRASPRTGVGGKLAEDAQSHDESRAVATPPRRSPVYLRSPRRGQRRRGEEREAGQCCRPEWEDDAVEIVCGKGNEWYTWSVPNGDAHSITCLSHPLRHAIPASPLRGEGERAVGRAKLSLRDRAALSWTYTRPWTYGDVHRQHRRHRGSPAGRR